MVKPNNNIRTIVRLSSFGDRSDTLEDFKEKNSQLESRWQTNKYNKIEIIGEAVCILEQAKNAGLLVSSTCVFVYSRDANICGMCGNLLWDDISLDEQFIIEYSSEQRSPICSKCIGKQ